MDDTKVSVKASPMEFEPSLLSFEEVVEAFCAQMDEVQAILRQPNQPSPPTRSATTGQPAGPAPRASRPAGRDHGATRAGLWGSWSAAKR